MIKTRITLFQISREDQGCSKCVINSRGSITSTFSSENITPWNYVIQIQWFWVLMVDTIHNIWLLTDLISSSKKKKHQELPLCQFSCFFNFTKLGLTDMGTFYLFVPINFKNKFQKGICPFTYGKFFFKNVLNARRKKKKEKNSPHRVRFTKFMSWVDLRTNNLPVI